MASDPPKHTPFQAEIVELRTRQDNRWHRASVTDMFEQITLGGDPPRVL